jgi:alanyl-tRNA synthetase
MAFGDIDSPYFSENGFVRKKCSVSELWFWTRDHDRTTSGDTDEDEYTFIGAPIVKGFDQRGKALKDAMRSKFLQFFENRSHTSINPYPIVARWRDDIHLTIASIADFQPHVTSGEVPPPANPLAISQPCIRLTDVAAVGRSGRHLTTFEMMAHHCFNRPDEGDVHYWIDQTIRYCDELFTQDLGIDPKEISYVENPWSGGGNAGPAVEVIVGGLELATLVFMNLHEDENGEIEIKGVNYSEMPLQIIDTGYGLERFCWAAAGTPTIYEAIYPETVSWLRELSSFDSRLSSLGDVDVNLLLSELSRLAGILNIDVGTDVDGLYERLIERLAERNVTLTVDVLKSITEPLSSIYAIPDHMHALCNMLADGLVPSNSKAGYLARMMARRTCRMKDDLGLKIGLEEIGAHHLDVNMTGSVSGKHRQNILTILSLEESRYREMLRAGEAAVRTAFKDIPADSENIPSEILFRLAEERGLQPEMVVSIAHDSGWPAVSVPVGFAADMAARHAEQARNLAKSKDSEGELFATNAPPTERMYYADTSQVKFQANVLACIPVPSSLSSGSESEGTASHAIVLDRTLFYPEGGGQLADQGSLNSEEETVCVLDAQLSGDVILHLTDGPLTEGPVVGELDWSRRKQLMDHHTAVHIVGGAAREVLGKHVWQAGSNKGARYARLDVTHHSRLDRSDLDAIEDLANSVVASSPLVEKLVLPRSEADALFGFELYQGGPPKHSEIRIIKIGDFDIQACGGTHHDDAGMVDYIRVVRSTLVQDGVERLHILAGSAARVHAKNQEDLLTGSADVLGVQPDDLPTAVNRFFTEWKDQKKRIESLEAEIVRLRTSGGGDDTSDVDGVRIVVMEVEGGMKQMQAMVKELTLDPSVPTVAVLGSRDGGGKLLVAVTENTVAAERVDASALVKEIAPHISGGGGGRPTYAQAGGSNPNGLDASLETARKSLGI